MRSSRLEERESATLSFCSEPNSPVFDSELDTLRKESLHELALEACVHASDTTLLDRLSEDVDVGAVQSSTRRSFELKSGLRRG